MKPQTMRQKFFMLKILGSESAPECPKFLYWVHQLENCDDIFAWMLKQGYCGKDLIPYLRSTFKGVDFNTHPLGEQIVAQHFAHFNKFDTFKLFTAPAH